MKSVSLWDMWGDTKQTDKWNTKWLEKKTKCCFSNPLIYCNSPKKPHPTDVRFRIPFVKTRTPIRNNNNDFDLLSFWLIEKLKKPAKREIFAFFVNKCTVNRSQPLLVTSLDNAVQFYYYIFCKFSVEMSVTLTFLVTQLISNATTSSKSA